jgi:hypothetical protein
MTATTDPATDDLGARNVIWNNDFSSVSLYKGGTAVAFTGGTMKDWIVAYNRFDHDMGFAIDSKGAGHEVLFLNNNFPVKSPNVTAVNGDVSGLKLRGNHFAGWNPDKLFAPESAPAENTDNRLEAAYAAPPRPKPPVPSLFEWQKQQVAKSPKPAA